MSTLRVALGETAGSIWVPILAGISELAAGNEKPIGALFEQDRPPHEIYSKVVHDEVLEPGWETFFSAILVRIARIVTPRIPEQIVIIPSKLLGAAWHWFITSAQSLNKQRSVANRNNNNNTSILNDFFEMFVKKPTDLFLHLCGVRNGNSNFLRYGLTQFGIFSLAGLGLKFSQDENLPGLNIDRDDPLIKNVFKTVGYSFVEELTYGVSQTIRNYIDFSEKEFGKGKIGWVKAIANVVNERLIPGHFLSALGGSLSTYYFGKIIPRTSAALFGEFPFKILNRVINCHRRRATKYRIKEVDGKTYYEVGEDKKLIRNHRFNSDGFNRLLNVCDLVFDKPRKLLLRGIKKIFGLSDTEWESVINSFTMTTDLPIGGPA